MTGAAGDGAAPQPPMRDAATVILVRQAPGGPEVLMGQRGASAAFMPNKIVFPGGALDPGDRAITLAAPMPPGDQALLDRDAGPVRARALLATAIRELWEETGLPLGRRAPWTDPVPADWRSFAAFGFRPSAEALSFVFRAITPHGRPRRFDARFFLADAATLDVDPEDFSRASDELSHLRWIPIAEARRHDLPFITEIVLAEVGARLRDGAAAHVPFFDNSVPGAPAFHPIA